MEILKNIAVDVGLALLVTLATGMVWDNIKNSGLLEFLKEMIFQKKNRRDQSTLDKIKLEKKIVDIIISTSVFDNKMQKKIFVSFNSSLVSSIAKIMEQASTANAEDRKSKTVVGMMLGEKLKKSGKTQLILVGAMTLNLLIGFIFESRLSESVFLICTVGLLGIYTDHKLIEYRIKNGWYGTNEYETRELINFILSHANPDDFNDSGGLKKVIEISGLSPNEESAGGFNGVTA